MSLRIIAGLLLREVALEVLALSIGRHQGVKGKGVAEREAGRPQVETRGGRQKQPQSANQLGVRRLPLEHNPAAVHERLCRTKQGRTFPGALQHTL